MADHYQYVGEELHLFEKAKKWKRYFAKKLKPYIAGNVLEVGAGIGETTAYLQTNKVNSWTCLEPDKNLFDQLQKKIDDKILPFYCKARLGTLSDLSADAKFDTIVYIDVLEHIENDRAELIHAVAFLKKNGHLIVLSPAFQLLYTPFDKAIGHYRRYTKKTLRQAAHLPQLIERKIFYLESSGAFLLLLNKLLMKKTYPSKRSIWVWQTLFIPVSKLLDKISFHTFGKTIIGIWQHKP